MTDIQTQLEKLKADIQEIQDGGARRRAVEAAQQATERRQLRKDRNARQRWEVGM